MGKKDFSAKPYIYPMPVLIVSTYDENGKANAMNAAWGGITGEDEITIDIGKHKTTGNLNVSKAFCVSIGTEEYVRECDYVGIVSGNVEPDKLTKAGFTTEKSKYVNAPVINELPMVLECSVKSYNAGKLIGKIINVGADESILTDGKIDVKKLKPISFDPVAHTYITLGNAIADAFSAGNEIK